MEYTASSPSGNQEPGTEDRQPTGLDPGTLFPLPDTPEDLDEDLYFFPDECDEDDAAEHSEGDVDDEDDMLESLFENDDDDAPDGLDEDDTDALDGLFGNDGDDTPDEEVEELLKMLSGHQERSVALAKRVAQEIRSYLEDHNCLFIDGSMEASIAFFIPSLGSGSTHFDLTILVEHFPVSCVQFKVSFPILCGKDMAPGLMLRFAELNESMRYFTWKYDPACNHISLSQSVTFWDADLSKSMLPYLMETALCLSANRFPELEWLSTGLVNAPVTAKKLDEMREFLSRLRESVLCPSPDVLQLLQDGLDRIRPSEDDG